MSQPVLNSSFISRKNVFESKSIILSFFFFFLKPRESYEKEECVCYRVSTSTKLELISTKYVFKTKNIIQFTMSTYFSIKSIISQEVPSLNMSPIIEFFSKEPRRENRGERGSPWQTPLEQEKKSSASGDLLKSKESFT